MMNRANNRENSSTENYLKKLMIPAILCIVLTISGVYAFAGGSERDKVPSVPQLSPDDEIAIDLTGKPGITFKWKSSPIPGGGRAAYRFKLIKGFKYDFIVSEELAQGVFSIDVPAGKFEDGATYSWYVEQRDASLNVWSRHDTVWSFKVIKR
jgi:hypothetical protein